MTVRDPLTLRSSAQRPSIDGIVGLLRALYTYDSAGDRMSLDVNFTISKTTTSTSVSTGAIVNAGGQGIAGPLFVGGSANIAGAVTLQSTLALATANVTGTPTITGSWSFDANQKIRSTNTVGSPSLGLELYSLTTASPPRMAFLKSASAVLGTLTDTIDQECLGQLDFNGVNTSQANTVAFRIRAVQQGAAGATLQSDLLFKSGGAGLPTIMTLRGAGGNLLMGAITAEGSGGVKNIVLSNVSAVLGAPAADKVSLAAVDVSAGDAALYIQPETASLHRFGKQAYHKQGVTTGAVAVLSLEQLDIDQAMLDLVCTIGTGNGIEAVAAKTLTTTHFVMVTIPGGLTRYLPVGTIA